MKRVFAVFVCIFLLSACNSDGESPLTTSHTIIDWVDFVVINNKQYESVYPAVITDSKYIGEIVGEVAFNVKDNVSNPSYDTKNGDAAFLEEGTKLFAIEGTPDFIAVKDPYQVNGYKIYFAENGSERYSFHFKDLDQSAINRVEIYQDTHGPQLLKTITNDKKINEFLKILNSGETQPGFSPDTSQGNPDRYQMIFYTEGEAFALNYDLAFDGNDWYWNPWDTVVLPDKINRYMSEE